MENFTATHAMTSARSEMGNIINRLKQFVARNGFQENLGQREIRKFHDEARAGKFGKMEWHEAAKLQMELTDKVEAL